MIVTHTYVPKYDRKNETQTCALFSCGVDPSAAMYKVNKLEKDTYMHGGRTGLAPLWAIPIIQRS